jgi:hypothetical protein
MKSLIYTISFLLVVFVMSCEDNGVIVNCSDCLQDDPVKTDLVIKLDDSFRNPVVLKIYEGNLEDNILLFSGSTISSSYRYEVTLNKRYTVTGTYITGEDTYIAVDSAFPKVEYKKDECDNPCYFIYGRKIDLRLKNIN